MSKKAPKKYTTPGPWIVESGRVYGPSGDLVAMPIYSGDAALIAAAPEMLEALGQLIRMEESAIAPSADLMSRSINMARSAVDKAKGKK